MSNTSKQTKTIATKSDAKNVTLVEIAASIKMSPKNARRIMRTYEGYTKSAKGWQFPASKKNEIVKFLQS